MKKDGAKKGTLVIHIGTEHVARGTGSIVHEASVLKQLKKIIETNNRIVREITK